MRPKNKIISLVLASCVVLLAGCEQSDIHEMEPIPKETYQKTVPETYTVQKGDMTPTLKFKLTQNSLKYYNYSVDVPNPEFSELKVSVGDYVKAGQVLVVLKSDELQKEYKKTKEELDTDKLLLEHTKKLRDIYVDPTKPDDEDNKRIAEGYDNSIALLEDDIRLKTIELAEKQRDLDKCVIKAKDDGMITYINNGLVNGIVALDTDLITQACGDVGFYAEILDDYEFHLGDVVTAVSPTTEFDIKVTNIEESQYGNQVVYFKPVSEDIVSVSSEVFEVTIIKEVIKDVVYIDEKLVYTSKDGQDFVYVVDEDGFKIPIPVEVDVVVDGQAIIKSGLEGKEEVAQR